MPSLRFYRTRRGSGYSGLRMRRRKIPILIAVLAVIAAIAIAIYLRSRTAPEAARLLPRQTDGILYIDAATLRRVAQLAGQTPAVPHDPEYQKFIEETGFEFERDLDKVAFAVHAPPVAQAGAAPAPPDYRFSEVFVARFDSDRVANYLRKLSTYVEDYRGKQIYNIPIENRTVRAAILGVNMVAVSNTQDTGPIHEMVDKYKELAMPFGGPELVRDYYHDVPRASVAWAIARVASDSQPGLNEPSSLRSLLPGAVLVTSLRYLGFIQLRCDAYAKNAEEAKRYADNVGTLLTVFRSVEANVQAGGADPDVKAFFDSISVEESGSRATLKASLPIGFIKKVLAEPPQLPGAEQQPAPTPPPAPKKKSRRRRSH